ncbi:hypothetical protein L211DRAFT_23294 [Terfezia boudieri ATCC MYA-4762]|uniref:Uncharacterized protein n=1 Tax=Terfezia boudieri ATCC MYA-4762 TaxID=1051890 RepID=A0A3N4MP64_9PEZI|nr:hypothetical protein L211DRAFT_23294 [Terfezia boudieri ATCC MYA-4762]
MPCRIHSKGSQFLLIRRTPSLKPIRTSTMIDRTTLSCLVCHSLLLWASAQFQHIHMHEQVDTHPPDWCAVNMTPTAYASHLQTALARLGGRHLKQKKKKTIPPTSDCITSSHHRGVHCGCIAGAAFVAVINYRTVLLQHLGWVVSDDPGCI